jgi:hypothetical protein
MKKTIFKILTISLTAVFAAFFAACPEEPGNDGGPGGHDIDKALYGTWEVENSSVLTITFSSEDGIEWGGTAGSMYNSLPVDKWTANNGVISMTYAGDTYTVYNYTINGSGELVLTSPETNIERTLVKTAGSGVFGDFEYSFNKSSLGITGYTGTGGVVEIPSTINGKSVTDIMSEAFKSKHLTGVTIPDSVIGIEYYAFADNQLTSVTIPDGVTFIGDYAFADNQLTSVDIPNSVTEIWTGAFANNQLTSVTIPNSVTKIWDGAFADNQLTSVTIPSGVTYIGTFAFADNQLTSVTIPSGVTYIGTFAFVGNKLTDVTVDSGNTKYAAENDFLMSKDKKSLISYFGSSKSVTIPDSVTKIEDYAFAYTQLTSVSIGNSVTTIGYQAFAGTQLTSVTIGANVTLSNSGSSSFPGDFNSVYNNGGKLAGTYTCPTAGDYNSTWTRQNP